MEETKMDWGVDNGVFCGFILCDKMEDVRLKDLGVNTEGEEHWLPVCIDLRDVSVIRARGFDEDAELTVLESFTNGDLGTLTIAVPVQDLRPHFIKSRQ